MSLVGKAFIVTGGASGIGRATVKKLLEKSAKVHVLDVADASPDPGVLGAQAPYYKVDVSSRDSVKAAFDKIAAHDERVSGLVHCAGILRTSDSSTGEDESVRRLWEVNTMGTWYTNTQFHQLVKAARERNAGAQDGTGVSIVNLGSMASVRGLVAMSGYCASKHAVLGLTRTFAQEWGAEGFRVNAVAPGAVNTPMIQGMAGGENINGAYVGAVKSLSEPEEIADTIIFLLSEGASSITGQAIEVNGGWP